MGERLGAPVEEERTGEQGVTHGDVDVGDVEHGPVVDVHEIDDVAAHDPVEIVPDRPGGDEDESDPREPPLAVSLESSANMTTTAMAPETRSAGKRMCSGIHRRRLKAMSVFST